MQARVRTCLRGKLLGLPHISAWSHSSVMWKFSEEVSQVLITLKLQELRLTWIIDSVRTA